MQAMANLWRAFINTPKLAWPAVLVLAALDAAGIYLLNAPEPVRAARPQPEPLAAVPKPQAPPPPAMIEPPAVQSALQSGTLIVISKKTQQMFVFQDGALWGTSRISTGKRHHATPSGVFPIIEKQRFHRSNIYSGAPMPFMQRLTWEGIALHAGYVPGYPASHGCVRVPAEFARALYKLTRASATTVVIGDAPLQSDAEARDYALTAQLPVRSALAPPPPPPPPAPPWPSLRIVETPAPGPAPAPALASSAPAPASALPPATGETVQLAAAPSPADADRYWAHLLRAHPELSRFDKRVEAATVNARQVYRLRISGADANGACAKLKRAGVGCMEVG